MNLTSKVVFFTSARSDFGNLTSVIKEFCKYVRVEIIATGAHTYLSKKNSIDEVKEFCMINNSLLELVDFNYSDHGNNSEQVRALSLAQNDIGDYLSKSKPDLIIIIGDRWEIFSISIPALIYRIPIAHISGGEITQGAIDECIRHSHTKLSHLHFVACKEYAKNISLMGEEDWRITISGECGLDWIHNSKIVPKENLIRDFNLSLSNEKKIALLTYHPTSYGNIEILDNELKSLVLFIKHHQNINFVITGPGMEIGSENARKVFRNLSEEFKHINYVESFGRGNYLSFMNYSDFLIGNSSSGIVEAPSFGIPSINIGNRQKGRCRADSVIDCDFNLDSIIYSMEQIFSEKFINKLKDIHNPYDPFLDGKNSDRIVKSCLKAIKKKGTQKLLDKKFDQNIDSNLWNSFN